MPTTSTSATSPLLASNTSSQLQYSTKYSSPTKRWICLIAVLFFTCLSSGPVTSWPTFEPILGKLGVLGSTPNQTSAQLDQVYAIGQGTVLLLGIPMGVLYDQQGPKTTAFIGGLLSCIGLCSMAISITNKSYNWWLYWAYPVSVGGGGLCSYSILGFIWLHPERQTLVGSLNGASLAISDSLALVGVYLVHQSICTLSTFFYVLAFVSCISVLAIIILSPSWQQNADHFQIANTCIDNDENINTTTTNNNTNNEDKTTTCSTFKNIWKTITKSKDVVVLFPGACALMQLCLTLFYFSAFYPSIVMYDYFECILNSKDAISLVNLFPVIYGILGAAATIMSGYLCDRIGIVKYMQSYVFLTIICAVLSVMSSYASKVAWLVVWTLFASAFLPFYMRFAQRYAPFEIFGTFMGCMSTFMPLLQMICGSTVNQAMKSIYPNAKDSRRYTVPFTILNVLTIVSILSIIVYWHYKPPPEQGTVVSNENGELVVLRQSNGRLYGDKMDRKEGEGGGGDDDEILKAFVRDHCNTGNGFRTRTNSEDTRTSICSEDIHEEISF